MLLTIETKPMKHSNAFGEFFKAKRQTFGLTLREFCLKHRLDPGNLSRLERGLLPPPENRSVLVRYTKYLNLKPGTDDWYTFFDLAAAAKGRIPQEILEDKDVAAKLPLVFRALRGKRLTDKQLDDLVKKVHAV